MLNSISSKKYSIKEDFVFTYASDLNRILDRFKKFYENKYGFIDSDELEARKYIAEIIKMLGHFEIGDQIMKKYKIR